MAEGSLPMDGDDDGQGDPPPPTPMSANASGRQLARNMAISYSSYFIGLALTLVLTRVLLRHLGAAEYGLWVVLLALVGYLGLLDAGVSTAVVQRIARLMAENDRAGVANLVRTAWVFFGASGVAAVIVTVVVAPFLSSILHLGTISPTVAGITLVVMGFATAATFVVSVPNAVLYGSGRGDRLAQIGFVALALTQAGQVVAVLAGAGLIGLAAISLASLLFGLLVTATVAGRITGTSIRHGRFDRRLLGELLRFGGLQTVVALAGVVAYQLDALVIGLILPIAQVASYNVALSTANFTRAVSTQGTNYLLPTYAHDETVGAQDRQARFFFRSVLLSMVLSVPMFIALVAFGDPLLHLWLGTVPQKSYEIVIVLGAVTALQLPGHQSFLFLTGVGRNRTLAPIALAGALVNLGGSIAATYWLGPVGPAVGSLPVVLVLDFTVLPVIVCHHVGVSAHRYLREVLVPVVPVAAVAGAAALLLVHLRPGLHGIGAVFAAVGVVLAAWVVAAYVVGRIEPGFRDAIWRRVRRTRTTGG